MYFVVDKINMCRNSAPPPDKQGIQVTLDTAAPLGSHDIQAATPVDAQRRISLDPTGFVVAEDGDMGKKSRRGNVPNFYVNCCGCKDDDVEGQGGNNKSKNKTQELYDEEFERIPIPEASSTSFSFRKLWAFTGPGLLMSIGYLDPGNIESDLQAGATAKHQLLWVLFWATLIGLLMQRLAARLGTVSGLHLAEACHRHYPAVPRLILWLLAEIAVIGAEMQEVIGSAIAFYLLSNQAIPLWVGVILAVLQSFALLILEQYGMRKLEAVFALMIGVMAVSFGYEYIKVESNELDVVKGIFVPGCRNCDKSALLQGVGIIGAVIMPHNLFLHSALVKSRDIDRSKPSEVKEANRYFFIEAAIALAISFIINMFIVSVFANGTWDEEGNFRKSNAEILQLCMQQDGSSSAVYTNLFPNDTTIFQPNIYTGGIFLGCQYGQIALYIWAIGILAAGQSSTMTGAYAGQYVMEGFLQLQIPRWVRSLGTRLLVFLPPFLVAKFMEMDQLSRMNDWLNVSMSLLLPFAALPLISMTSKEDVMDHKFRNGKGIKIVSCALVIFLIALNMYFICSFLAENVPQPINWTVFLAGFSFGVLYVSLCSYLFCHVLMVMDTCWWSVETVAKVVVAVAVNMVILVLAYFSAF